MKLNIYTYNTATWKYIYIVFMYAQYKSFASNRPAKIYARYMRKVLFMIFTVEFYPYIIVVSETLPIQTLSEF